jgi:hypothetical protein
MPKTIVIEAEKTLSSAENIFSMTEKIFYTIVALDG